MLIPNKFSGYASCGRRTYFVDGGAIEGAIIASLADAGAAAAAESGIALGGEGIAGLFGNALNAEVGAGLADTSGALMPSATSQGLDLSALENPATGTVPAPSGSFMPEPMDLPAPTDAATYPSTLPNPNASPTSGNPFSDVWDKYKKLDTFDKMAMTLGGTTLASKLFGQNHVGLPAAYRGNNLQKFQYDPSRFTPSRPFNQGGLAALAAGGAVPHNVQIDDYVENTVSSDQLQALLAKARAGDYNAMIALNKMRGTPNQNYAAGGQTHLGGYSDGGRLLKGPGDGMSDSIPAHIGGKQPAALADGEFVIPADVVSHLGNGSTDAGAKQLYAMMDRIRKARTGNPKQGKQINAHKYLPRG